MNDQNRREPLTDSKKQLYNAKARKRRADAIEVKMYYCGDCDTALSSHYSYTLHMNSKRHARVVDSGCNKRVSDLDPDAKRNYFKMAHRKHRKKVIEEKRFHCKICDITVSSSFILKSHMKSDRHILKKKIYDLSN